MSGLLIPQLYFLAEDDNGAILPGALVASTLAGTATAAPLYTDQALLVSHPNPAVCDAAGRLVAYMPLGTAYDLAITTSAGVAVKTITNVSLPAAVVPPSPNAVPTGTILAYGGTAAPTGYLLCNGAAVDRVVYVTLFTAIGVAFGAGDGATTFNVPDLRGRFPLGKPAAGTGSTLGGTGGTIDHTHTVTVGSSGAHTHTTGQPKEAAADVQIGAGEDAASPSHTHDIASSGAHTHTGSADAQNPPFQSVNWIIKT